MIENNLKCSGLELFYFMWSFKTEECEGSVTAVQCFRKANSEIKNFIEYWKKNSDKRIQIHKMLLYVKKKQIFLNFYSGGEGEKHNSPSKLEWERIPECKSLKQVIKSKHKAWREWKRDID